MTGLEKLNYTSVTSNGKKITDRNFAKDIAY